MSGIFDKYLNMINGSKNTFGQMHTKTNANVYVKTVNGKEVYIPKKARRSSSSASAMSDASVGEMLRNGSVSSTPGDTAVIIEETEIKPVKILSEPNNRVNF